MPQRPKKPDATFNARYYKSFRYAFLLETPGKDLSAIIGSDDEGDGDYIELALNPQQISVSEPIATQVTLMQGGGKVVESRGGVIKEFRISGTTGYLPTPVPGQSQAKYITPSDDVNAQGSSRPLFADDKGGVAERSRAERSGFAQFHKLRYLFRKFMHLRRTGQEVYMHYLDFKGDEYWLIEPQSFVLNRVSGKPFSYAYNIAFQGLEPTDTPQVNKEDVSSPVNTPAKVAARMTVLRFSGLGFLKKFSGIAERSLQAVLNDVGNYVQVITDAGSVVEELGYELPHNLLSQLSSSIRGAFDALGILTGAIQDTRTTFSSGPGSLSEEAVAELNEFYCELKLLSHIALVAHQKISANTATSSDAAKKPFSESRATGGFAADQITQDPSSATSLLDASFLADSTSGLTFSSTVAAAQAVRILSGETIYDVARRQLGSVHNALALITLNKLVYPYIVSNEVAKPSRTLAWGEVIFIPVTTQTAAAASGGIAEQKAPGLSFSGVVDNTGTTNQLVQDTKEEPWRIGQWIGYSLTMTVGSASSADPLRIVVDNDEDTLVLNRPWTVTPNVGDKYTLTLDTFTLRKATDRYTQVFGRDVLLFFNKLNDGISINPLVADVRINSRRDLATVSGMENFNQALVLKLSTERGRHPFHRTFGVGVPIGRRADEAHMLAYTYFVRQSLLADPRVSEINQPQLEFLNGALKFQAYVRPVGLKQSKFITISL